jgi:hypothetical protein
MAHAALVDDNLKINGLDMYTWTNTFGVPTDGFYKDQMIDGTYIRGTDEQPTAPQDENPATDHFDPLRLNESGPMYLKEIYPKYAPDQMFPARKYEYENGKVTFARPGQPFHFEDPITPPRKGWFEGQIKDGQDWIPIILLVIVLLFVFRNNLKFLKS